MFKPRSYDAHLIDAMLLDIGLPSIDGYELAPKIRALPEVNGATLIAISGYGQPEDLKRATAAGFDHYLVKPVDLPSLRTLLSQAVTPALMKQAIELMTNRRRGYRPVFFES